MISIQIKKLTKRFGPVVALQNLDLTINPGELFFLLGPSGCGKTTLLRCLAGFCRPDEGRIWFGEEEVTALAPHRRNAGMVFQSYALWPHLTVAENVSFGLEERQLPRDENQASYEAGARGGPPGPDCFDRKPTSCRAASNNGSLSHAPWSSGRAACCSMNRSRTWTRGASGKCGARSGGLQGIPADRGLCDPRPEGGAFDRRSFWRSWRPGGSFRSDARARSTGGPRAGKSPASSATPTFIPGKVVAGGGGRAVVETALGRIDGVLGDPTLPRKLATR